MYRFEPTEAVPLLSASGAPATSCDYRVVSRGVNGTVGRGLATPWHTVKLPDVGADAARLVVSLTSDSQGGAMTLVQLVDVLAAQHPDLHVLLGDVVQEGWAAEQWVTQFLGPMGHAYDFGARVPSLVTRGNHDVTGRDAVHGFFGEAPTYGAYELGAAFVLVLDSNVSPSPVQLDWIAATLASAPAQAARFRMVLVHLPPFIEFWDPVAWARGENRWGWWVRDEWAPLFERYRVDLVLSGHEHAYQRGQRNGTHYVIAGGAGGELESERVADYGMYTVTRLEHHGGLLEIRPDRLRWQALSPLGDVLDTLDLAPRPGGPLVQ